MPEPSIADYHIKPSNSPLVVIVGETASGKSALALDLAKQFNGEIIGADSWTVYDKFNIGTAKPSKQDMSEVKHHLFGFRDPRAGFNAALFKELALQAISDIQSRGKLPILVGGTGLYIDSVIFDYSFMPPGSPEERTRRNAASLTDLISEADTAGINLQDVDVRNKRRVIRALETGGQQPERRTLRENTCVIGLITGREKLNTNIEQRVDNMLEQGLEKEVRSLSDEYGWEVEPMKGIGYFEWRDYFAGTQDLPQTRQRIINSTLKLAKRQRTWFKRNNSIQWVNNREEAVDIVTTLLNKKS